MRLAIARARESRRRIHERERERETSLSGGSIFMRAELLTWQTYGLDARAIRGENRDPRRSEAFARNSISRKASRVLHLTRGLFRISGSDTRRLSLIMSITAARLSSCIPRRRDVKIFTSRNLRFAICEGDARGNGRDVDRQTETCSPFTILRD